MVKDETVLQALLDLYDALYWLPDKTPDLFEAMEGAFKVFRENPEIKSMTSKFRCDTLSAYKARNPKNR